MQVLFEKTIDLLADMLDYRARRHGVIVSNVANLDTPGYRPRDLDFKKTLEEVTGDKSLLGLKRTNEKHLASPFEKRMPSELVQTGEKVNMDREMARLAENNLMYNLTVELLSRKFKSINTVLKETR